MDNVTHALAGVAVAQVALARTPEPSRGRLWGPLHLGAIVASNAPDLDLVYTGITEGRLGYLLHHRGHTHTVVVALILAGVVAAGIEWFVRRRARAEGERVTIWGVMAICALLHVAMDYGNKYGVHPWWPWDNRWFYGDTIFIIEPWLTCALSLPAVVHARSRAARWVLLALVGIAIVGTWLLPLPWTSGVGVTVWALLLGTVAWVIRGRDGWSRIGFTVGAVVIVYGIGWGTHRRAVASYIEGTSRAYRARHETLLDVMAAPLPATFWCRDVIAIGVSSAFGGSSDAASGRASEGGVRLVMRLARISLWPALTTAAACPSIREEGSAPQDPSVWTPDMVDLGDAVLRSDAVVGLPLDRLQAMAEQCETAAFLRFARAPFEAPQKAGPDIVGDLRFDRSRGLDFAEIEWDPSGDCPAFVPGWIPPRADALEWLDQGQR